MNLFYQFVIKSKKGGKLMKVSRVTLLLVFLLSFILTQQVFAHCDTLDGPVVSDAKKALEKRDVTPVLKWVKKDAEPEIRNAFKKALSERKVNKESSDMNFFETLIRVHRSGEGATFSGVKPSGSVEPIIAGADKALETGSIDILIQEISEHLKKNVQERFNRAYELKKNKDKSVKAGREYVEAYVEYVHYIEGLHTAIAGKLSHHNEESKSDEHKGHVNASNSNAHQEETVNILENIPYQEQKMGSRKIVDEKYLLMMQAALKPGQSVPQHTANSNVNILVVRGEVVVNLNGTESVAKEGLLVPIAYKTSMSVVNKSNKDASFLIIKTPNPSEMGE